MSETSNLETNIDIAHRTADYLNVLVDKKFLTVKDVSNANDEAIIEFMDKIGKGKFPNDPFQFPNYLQDKVRTLFSSETVDVKQEPTRNEIIFFGQEFLRHLKDHGFDELEGILLFGSRLNPNKKPRKDSDLDGILFLKKSTLDIADESLAMLRDSRNMDEDLVDPTSLYSEFDIWARNFARKYDFLNFVDINFSVAGLSNEDILNYDLDYKEGHETPFWGFSPKSVYFVGKLGGKNESEVNEMIQKSLTSLEALKIKEALIQKIRKDFMMIRNNY